MDSVVIQHLEVCGFPPRQAQTLALTALGLTAKEIAKKMGISPRTVEMNLTLAMLRLGARNRAHLITQAVTAGLLFVRRAGAAILICCTVSIASVPTQTNADTDWMFRLSARNARARTLRRDHFGVPA